MKIIAETFPNMTNQNRIFKIPFKSVNNIITKGSIDTYCSVLQHFVRANPPVCNGFIINPMKTKIGYRFKTDDSIDLIIQIEVNKIDINILEMIPANGLQQTLIYLNTLNYLNKSN